MSKLTKEQAAQIEAELGLSVGECNGSEVTKGAVILDSMRQQITKLLAAYDFESYEEYRKLKYASFEPTIEERKAAYLFAFEKLLNAAYTESLA